MKVSHLIIQLLLVSSACIDSFNLKVGSVEKVLVVDGMITNAAGPYTIKLVWSSDVGAVLTYATPVTNAKVSIADDQGNVELLSDQGSGIYQTQVNGFQGIAGRTYHTEIITADGQSYASTPELLATPGSIDSLYFEFKYGTAIVSGQPTEHDGFNIYVDGAGNELLSQLRWSWTGVYKAFTHPELERNAMYCCPTPYAPALCSGYICADAKCLTIKKKNDLCTCCTCFITENQTVPFLSDHVLARNSFQKYQVAFIPFEPRNFFERYNLHLRQFTISNQTYQFWKLIQSQIASGSSLFQPPIAPIKGNIIALTGSASARGIFSACGLTEKTIWIYRKDVPFVFEDPIITESCTDLDATSTTTVPPFWN